MRRGDLFVLSWESLRRVEWGKVSSFLSYSPYSTVHCLYVSLLRFFAQHITTIN